MQAQNLDTNGTTDYANPSILNSAKPIFSSTMKT